MYQATYFYHSRNIQIIWWRLRSTGCIYWYIENIFLFFVSKIFDKVWHQGLHYKLRQNSIFDELLNTLTDFLDNRTLRVILNGQYSSWTKVEAGVPQSSIFGPLLFLIYINDLSQNQTLNYLLVTPHSSL